MLIEHMFDVKSRSRRARRTTLRRARLTRALQKRWALGGQGLGRRPRLVANLWKQRRGSDGARVRRTSLRARRDVLRYGQRIRARAGGGDLRAGDSRFSARIGRLGEQGLLSDGGP